MGRSRSRSKSPRRKHKSKKHKSRRDNREYSRYILQIPHRIIFCRNEKITFPYIHSSRRRSYSSSNSDDSIDHRRNNKRSRKLDEVERLAEIERLRKQREIEDKVSDMLISKNSHILL